MSNCSAAVTRSEAATPIIERSRAVSSCVTAVTAVAAKKKCAPCVRARCVRACARASACACACRVYLVSSYNSYNSYTNSKSSESLVIFCNCKRNCFRTCSYKAEVAHG